MKNLAATPAPATASGGYPGIRALEALFSLIALVLLAVGAGAF